MMTEQQLKAKVSELEQKEKRLREEIEELNPSNARLSLQCHLAHAFREAEASTDEDKEQIIIQEIERNSKRSLNDSRHISALTHSVTHLQNKLDSLHKEERKLHKTVKTQEKQLSKLEGFVITHKHRAIHEEVNIKALEKTIAKLTEKLAELNLSKERMNWERKENLDPIFYRNDLQKKMQEGVDTYLDRELEKNIYEVGLTESLKWKICNLEVRHKYLSKKIEELEEQKKQKESKEPSNNSSYDNYKTPSSATAAASERNAQKRSIGSMNSVDLLDSEGLEKVVDLMMIRPTL